MKQLFVQALGAFTSVGLDVGMTMGSLRVGYGRFVELPITGPGGAPLVAAPTILDSDLGAGQLRMLAMAGHALRECGAARAAAPTPLVLCGPDPREVAVDYGHFFQRLALVSGVAVDAAASAVFLGEHAALAMALERADALLAAGAHDAVYVGGVDSLLDMPRLRRLLAAGRIAGEGPSDGFVPGEAAVFLCLSRRRSSALAWIRGVGAGDEPPPRLSGKVSAVGLSRAMLGALADAGATIADVASLALDLTGERLAFYEAAVASTRLKPRAGQAWSTWNPAISVGEVGAAYGPLALAFLAFKIATGGFAGVTTSPGGAAAMVVGTAEERLRGAVFVSEVPRG